MSSMETHRKKLEKMVEELTATSGDYLSGGRRTRPVWQGIGMMDPAQGATLGMAIDVTIRTGYGRKAASAREQWTQGEYWFGQLDWLLHDWLGPLGTVSVQQERTSKNELYAVIDYRPMPPPGA